MSSENTKSSGAAKGMAGTAVFDHEKLDVYQLELRFIEWVTPLLTEAVLKATGKPREVCDQLDRASLSLLLNTAEGNGRRQGQGRAKFFDDARGSATECAACLDALVAKKIFESAKIQEGKVILLRIVSILCKLVDRFDVDGRFREETLEYRVSMESGAETGLRADSNSRTRTKKMAKESYGPNQN